MGIGKGVGVREGLGWVGVMVVGGLGCVRARVRCQVWMRGVRARVTSRCQAWIVWGERAKA